MCLRVRLLCLNVNLRIFSYFTKNVIPTDGTYCHRWQELADAIKLPEMPFTNFYAIKEFSRVIPKESILHLSILNATRLMQFFEIDPSIKYIVM